MADIDALLDDLAIEGDELHESVSIAGPRVWDQPTPAQGWSIATQVAHLCWTDTVAAQAASDPAAFNSYLNELLENSSPEQLSNLVDDAAFKAAGEPRSELLSRWREGRTAMIAALRNVPAGQKVPWFGPPMSAASMATARLMETWAHGQDVADALGVTRTPTSRLRNIAHIGVRTRDFAFVNNNLEVPDSEFRVTLTAPDGTEWTWGPQDATEVVSGTALDFCLLVTQRRHRSDLALEATGDGARTWLDIAQAFAGPPGTGREPTK